MRLGFLSSPGGACCRGAGARGFVRLLVSRGLQLGLAGLLAGRLAAEEKKFDFSTAGIGQPPPNTTSLVAGEGKPGDWRVILDDVPLEPDAFSSNLVAKKSVIAQMARDTTDEHFPLLVLGNDSYGNFTFTTKFKLVDGNVEQMAGIAFRIQDEKNFYVIRASGLGGTLYFYRFEKGLRTAPVGNNIKFTKGVWHELGVQCEGTKITVLLDGKPAMPTVTDNAYSSGKLGVFTKSDAVSYFTDARVTYVPKVAFAQQMVDDTLKDYARLLGLKVFVLAGGTNATKLIAGNDPKEIGQPGGRIDADVINLNVREYHREKSAAVVTLPLCDRNGDPVASVRILLRPITGQTEDNAYQRALPIIKTMQERVAMVKTLTD